MSPEPRRAAVPGLRERSRFLHLVAGIGAITLVALALVLGWREQVEILDLLTETAARTRVSNASWLAGEQSALAARVAVVVETQDRVKLTAPGMLRVERQPGPDAVELVASSAATRLAVGGVLVIEGEAAPPGQGVAVRQLLASLSAQRLALDASPEAEAIYIAIPAAQVVSRVPYVGAEQLRVRQGDARLGDWYAQEILSHRTLHAGEPVDEPWITRDPLSGALVLRVDQPSWSGASNTAANVIVTVPVMAYLRRLGAAGSPLPILTSIIAADGVVAGSAIQHGGSDTTALMTLPAGLASAIPSMTSDLERFGGWYAARFPIPETRLTAIVAVPALDLYQETLRHAGVQLALVLLSGMAFALFLRFLRTRVLDPAERAFADLASAELLVTEVTDGVPGIAVFQIVRPESGRTSVAFVSHGTATVIGVPSVLVASEWNSAFETVVPEEVAAVRAHCERALTECIPWQQEFRVRRRDEERWIRVDAQASREGEVVKLTGSWADVTEGRTNTALIADAHRRLVELADGVPGAVLQWRVTTDGRREVVFVGNRLHEIAGVSTSELYSGLHAFERVQIAEDVEGVRRARQIAVASGTGYEVEYRIAHPGTGLRWLREEAVSHSAIASLAAFTVHITDITQLRKEAGELRRARDEAEMATRAKSVFLATMSHEIRTPMTGISGMIEVLGRTVLDADQRQQLATISDSAHTLRRILDDVLDFSRIEAGKMTVERCPISIDDMVEATAGLYAPAAADKGVGLRAMVDPRIGELVMGDAVRLRQVLGNLLANAVKFTHRGSVRISVTQEDVNDTHRALLFEVTDTGVGIPYDIQPKLFSPFERGSQDNTSHVGGTGLGLALVRRIVELMDGTVELRSLPGVGTAVQVRIALERLHEETSENQISLAGLRIAVMHDNEIDLRFYASLVEGRGAAALIVQPDRVAAIPEGTGIDVIVVGPDVPRETTHELRARVGVGASGRTQIVRFLAGASIRPEVRGDGGVTLSPHARRSSVLRAVSIAAGRDAPDLPPSASQARSAAKRVAAVVSVADAEAERRLILVCEDHPIAQRVIERQLKVLGFAAELHDNGQSGFTAWRSGRYGLVLTDLHMPEMDGLTLARRIRAEENRHSELGRTPIIALSGNAYDEQRVICVEAGMDDFLAKPTMLKELDATLRFWLPPSQSIAAEFPLDCPDSLPETLQAPLSHRALRESLGDDPDTLHEALGEFLAADSDDFAVLYAAVEADDRKAVVGSAHRIEGAARMLGALPYARAAERVKRLFGLDHDPVERVDSVHRLQQEGERLRTWLHTTRTWFERVALSAGD